MGKSTIRNNNVPYIEGTESIWTYRKYNDHTYIAWYDGSINIGVGHTYGGVNGLYYHESVSSYSPPSFSKTVIRCNGWSTGAQLIAWLGYNLTKSKYAFYWLSPNSTSRAVSVHFEVQGTW